MQATGHLSPSGGGRVPISIYLPWLIPLKYQDYLFQMRVPTGRESHLIDVFYPTFSGTIVFALGHTHLGAEESFLIA